MTVIVNHGDDTIIDSVGFGRDRQFDELVYDVSGTYRYILNNIEPDVKDRITIMFGKNRGLFGEYKGQFGGGWDGEWEWNRMLLEEYGDILYTRNQIKLFISFFYAMHGYDFENQLLKDYFQSVNPYYIDSIKYRVDPDFSEYKFNGFERKNIDYLLHLKSMIPPEDNPFAFDNFLELLLSAVESERTSNIPEDGNGVKDIKGGQSEELHISAQDRNNINKQFIFRIGKFIIIAYIIVIIAVICFFVVKKKR